MPGEYPLHVLAGNLGAAVLSSAAILMEPTSRITNGARSRSSRTKKVRIDLAFRKDNPRRNRRKCNANNRMFDLSGRISIVAGGNGGIGRAIALGIGRARAAVAVLARNEEKNQRSWVNFRHWEFVP
jgi:hypothetical protein